MGNDTLTLTLAEPLAGFLASGMGVQVRDGIPFGSEWDAEAEDIVPYLREWTATTVEVVLRQLEELFANVRAHSGVVKIDNPAECARIWASALDCSGDLQTFLRNLWEAVVQVGLVADLHAPLLGAQRAVLLAAGEHLLSSK